MDKRSIAWHPVDEKENYEKYGVCFSDAKEVILNSSSIYLRNVFKDFTFIGPTNDLLRILFVTCIPEEGLRKIVHARLATNKEQDAYFSYLANGGL